MTRTTKLPVWRWALAALLFAGACWTGNLSLFNWWAAGGPPTPQPEVFEHRGNVFFLVTVVQIILLAILFVANLRYRKRSQDRE